MFRAEILAHSINYTGTELITFRLFFPRFILAEVTRHRMLSFNVSSSRAMSLTKTIDYTEEHPVIPKFWSKNCKGMSSSIEIDDDLKPKAEQIIRRMCREVVKGCRELDELKLHKQVVNRYLEPFSPCYMICTATDWTNFFRLRLDKSNVEPHMHKLACLMYQEYILSIPQYLEVGEWHIPLVKPIEVNSFSSDLLLKLSVARVARNSFHSTRKFSTKEDIELADKLRKNKHFSCFEMQAKVPAFRLWPKYYGNFKNWKQYRKTIKFEKGDHAYEPKLSDLESYF